MTNDRPSWRRYYMSACYQLALRSPDRSTKVGAIITTADHVHVCSGYNGLPRGIDDADFFHKRPGKYHYFEHAERNAFYNGARVGARIDTAHTLYCTCPPCSDCSRAIIQAGIKEVVYHAQGGDIIGRLQPEKSRHDWFASLIASRKMFDLANVKIHMYSEPLLPGTVAYISGEKYNLGE